VKTPSSSTVNSSWRDLPLYSGGYRLIDDSAAKEGQERGWFLENHLVIARLDKLSRDVQIKLEAPDGRWDLVVVDGAHKMSATFFGGEIKYTKRYRLGQLLSGLARQYLLMTATPHNGKEEDFQLFLGLLDGDRFEGRFRDGVHAVDVTDLMRRMVKEDLNGTPLFPERIVPRPRRATARQETEASPGFQDWPTPGNQERPGEITAPGFQEHCARVIQEHYLYLRGGRPRWWRRGLQRRWTWTW
jgi:hypothetical protein